MKHIYILHSLKKIGVLYIGVTSNCYRRVKEHNEGLSAHTRRFCPWQLVYVENYERDVDAFRRERQLKGWTKAKKYALVKGNLERLKNLSRRRG